MKTKKVKEKKCAYCKQPFIPFQFNQKVCNWPSPCAEKAGKEKIAKERERIEKNRKRLENKEKADFHRSQLTQSQWLKVLQPFVNKIARLIDSDFPCISSSRTIGKWNGGHYYTVKAHGNLRFHLFNIYKQSFSDNHHKSGNITEYSYNLFRIFGSDFVNNEIFTLDVKYPVLKLSIPEIKEKIEICRGIIKRQEKGEFIAKTTQERISIRIELNNLIGIYKCQS